MNDNIGCVVVISVSLSHQIVDEVELPENRAQTTYQDGKATSEGAESMIGLAAEIHAQIINLAGQSHGCICE